MAAASAAGRTKMNRLYVAESTPTITGAMADHRLPIASSAVSVRRTLDRPAFRFRHGAPVTKRRCRHRTLAHGGGCAI